MRLVAGGAASAHFLDAHHHFDDVELIHYGGNFGRSQTREDLHYFGARHVNINNLAGNFYTGNCHHFFGEIGVDGVVGNEQVVEIKLFTLFAVHLYNDAVLYFYTWGGIVGAAHGNQANFGPFSHKAVFVDFPCIQHLKSFLSFSHRFLTS